MTIDIEVGAAPIRGWLSGPGEPARRFESWLDLVCALDRSIAAGEPSPHPNGVGHADPTG